MLGCIVRVHTKRRHHQGLEEGDPVQRLFLEMIHRSRNKATQLRTKYCRDLDSWASLRGFCGS